MPERIKWVAMSYSLPAEPSKNRVYAWRKLRELGAAPVSHGIAALPKNSKKVPELVLLCERVKELGGEAAMIEMTFVSARDEQALVRKFRELSEQEYSALLEHCDKLLLRITGRPVRADDETGDEIRRMVRQYGRAKSRNHFGTASETDLERRIDRIFDRCVQDASEFAVQLKKLLDKAKF